MVEGIDVQKNKTALGIDENIEGALCYVLGIVSGILFLVLEKENKFVKFHATQSIVTFLPLMVIYIFLGMVLFWIPFIGWLIYMLLSLLIILLWLILMLKAFQGEKYKLPIVGDIVEKQIGHV